QFNANPEDEPGRFLIHFAFCNNVEDNEAEDLQTPKVYAVNKDVYIQLPQSIGGEIYIFDIMGKLIANKHGISNTLNKLTLTNKSGIYIVNIVDNEMIYSEKVFIK
ncbi:MAG: T9SS type A sorting domain-containing protein, partial [Bacteroidales bacterium]|nr:T9SS type A sorting domain-containing protein [Bacteroidales bacterium]